MASGIYNRLSLTAATYTNVITTSQVATGKVSVVTLNIVNTSASANTNIRVALSATATPVAGEFLEYDTQLKPSGVLERTGIVVPTGMGLVVYSSAADTNAVAYGLEG
jgi:hypothetical protein